MILANLHFHRFHPFSNHHLQFWQRLDARCSCSPRGAWAVPTARQRLNNYGRPWKGTTWVPIVQNFNKSYGDQYQVVHSKWVMMNHPPSTNTSWWYVFVGKAYPWEILNLYVVVMATCTASFGNRHPCSAPFKWQYRHISGTGVSDWSLLQLKAAKSVLRKAWGEDFPYLGSWYPSPSQNKPTVNLI